MAHRRILTTLTLLGATLLTPLSHAQDTKSTDPNRGRKNKKKVTTDPAPVSAAATAKPAKTPKPNPNAELVYADNTTFHRGVCAEKPEAAMPIARSEALARKLKRCKICKP